MRRQFYWDEWVMPVLAVVLIAGIAVFVFFAIKADAAWTEKCESAGGWKHHYDTTYYYDGKTLIPIAQYECMRDGKVLFQ